MIFEKKKNSLNQLKPTAYFHLLRLYKQKWRRKCINVCLALFKVWKPFIKCITQDLNLIRILHFHKQKFFMHFLSIEKLCTFLFFSWLWNKYNFSLIAFKLLIHLKTNYFFTCSFMFKSFKWPILSVKKAISHWKPCSFNCLVFHPLSLRNVTFPSNI